MRTCKKIISSILWWDKWKVVLFLVPFLILQRTDSFRAPLIPSSFTVLQEEDEKKHRNKQLEKFVGMKRI